MPEDSDATSPETTPAQDPRAPVAPVPAPGHPDSSAAPGVSDASESSPGAWTAVAAPGKPDGEVDTRS